ncbi:MAG: ABC transporter permease subunit [Bacteroidota bacterium]|nr:ABC transporter permease subunit [Bacteroidota bacterium]
MMLTPDEWSILGLSVRVALLAVALIVVPGAATAWYLSRRHTHTAFIVENLVQLPLVLPPVVTGLALLVVLGPEGPVGHLLGLQIAFTGWAAAGAAGIMAFPLLVQTFRVAFEQIDPQWEEAVLVFGGGRWDAFRLVTVPIAAKGVLAGIVLGFARAIGEFGATMIFAGNLPGRTQTIPLAVFSRLGQIGGEVYLIRLVLIAVLLSALSLTAHAVLTRRLHRN